MAQFKKRIFGEEVPKDVIEEFKKLAGGGLDGTSLQPLETRNPTFKKYLGERTPFSRMWSAVNINSIKPLPKGQTLEKKNGEYFYIDKEEINNEEKTILGNDKDSSTRVFVVNENTEESYTNNNPLDSIQSDGTKSLGQIKQLQHNPLMKPAAGITSVTSKTQGALGALRNTTVEFAVHNKKDFDEIFLPYFLRPGALVCVDYGWSDSPLSLYNPIDQLKNSPLDMSDFDEFLYGDEKKKTGYLAKNYGKMNTTIGNVVSYESSMTPEGSFNCSLEIVSRNTGLLDKDVSEENDLRFVFSNIIDDVLVSVLAKAANQPIEEALTMLRYTADSLSGIDTLGESKAFFTAIGNSTKLGLISEFASKTGIFYQDLTYNLNASVNQDTEIDESVLANEEIYISWGLFEDLFLNNMVAGVVTTEQNNNQTRVGEKTSIFTKDPTKDFSHKFDSRTTYVRYDILLQELQTQPLLKGESLPLFVIPETWDESYNAKVLNKFDEESSIGKWRATSQEAKSGNHPKYKGIPVMPLRDVFISVPMISKAFETKQTVDDVLISILDQMNSYSNKVWNLKLSSFGVQGTNIAVVDANLHPKLEDRLIFDVTSETSIVSNCDLKFTTPKAGLSSIIAISNISSPTRFDRTDLSALNHLNLLNLPTNKEDDYLTVRSLPIQGDTNKLFTQNGRNIDFDSLQSSIDDVLEGTDLSNDEMGGIEDKFKSYKIAVKEKIEEEIIERGDNYEVNNSDTYIPDYSMVTSYREYYKTLIRNKTYDKTGENTITPILPVELDLSIYGNNYLQIGDYFNINYLPAHYKDRVFFQIVGIEDAIGVDGWTTSYTSVMRVVPDKKYLVSGERDPDRPVIDPRLDKLSKSSVNSGCNPIIENYTRYAEPVRISLADRKLFEDNGLQFRVLRYLVKHPSLWNSNNSITDKANLVKKSYYHRTSLNRDTFTLVDDLAYSYAIRDSMLFDNRIIDFKDKTVRIIKGYGDVGDITYTGGTDDVLIYISRNINSLFNAGILNDAEEELINRLKQAQNNYPSNPFERYNALPSGAEDQLTLTEDGNRDELSGISTPVEHFVFRLSDKEYATGKEGKSNSQWCYKIICENKTSYKELVIPEYLFHDKKFNPQILVHISKIYKGYSDILAEGGTFRTIEDQAKLQEKIKVLVESDEFIATI